MLLATLLIITSISAYCVFAGFAITFGFHFSTLASGKTKRSTSLKETKLRF
jgi:hypothetical protein